MYPRVLTFAALVCLAGSAYAETQAHPPAEGKHIEIDKTTQTLRAYDGDQLYLQSHISTGISGKNTPNGEFEAESKQRMHYSRLFHHAPMPFSVQIHGNYFIHGFKSVPDHPASHGCIRLPIDEAHKLYDWVEPGTPVEIHGHWQG